MMNIVGRGFTIPEFKNYVDNLRFNGWTPNFVVVHNTSSPTQALYKSWHSRPGWTGEQWMKNLASYYAGMGWNGCPHLFVAYDKILVLNSLTVHGTHTPSWNKFSWGVETVAEFNDEPFEGGVKDNLVAALAILHSRIGLNPADYKLGVRGLHFHKEDKGTTHKDCPGKKLVKSTLVRLVLDYMGQDHQTIDHPEVSEASQTADTSKLTDEELISVTWLQTQLNKYDDADLFVDGIIGTGTRSSVKAYQQKKGLKVDGIAGPLTRLALKNETPQTFLEKIGI